jgi:hypothetical protein
LYKCIISNKVFFLKSFISFLPPKYIHFTPQGFHENSDLVTTAPRFCIAKVLPAADVHSVFYKSLLEELEGVGAGGGGVRETLIGLLMTL